MPRLSRRLDPFIVQPIHESDRRREQFRRLDAVQARQVNADVLATDLGNVSGRASTGTVEPVQLAHAGGQRWYLVAWDLGREDWRTLRVDRIAGRVIEAAGSAPRSG